MASKTVTIQVDDWDQLKAALVAGFQPRPPQFNNDDAWLLGVIEGNIKGIQRAGLENIKPSPSPAASITVSAR